MPTDTDNQFTARFPDMTASVFYGSGQVALAGYTPNSSPINTGMLADIGKATIYGPEKQDNPFSKFIRSPLARGDSAMTARFSEVTSHAFDPLAPDTALFDGSRPSMLANVMTKNLSRQVRVEINDRELKKYTQTEDMIGDCASAIMAVSNVAYMDDMFVASKEYFSGSTRGALADQMHTLTANVGDAGFADEMTELLWTITQRQFGYKSTKYNKSGVNTKANEISVIMRKDAEFPAFKKLYAETFNPEFLKMDLSAGYVDSFATTAGKPSGAGELVAIVCDNRAFEITPMPEALTVGSFVNPARANSITYFTTYEYAFGHNPFFDCAYIFAPGA